MKVKKTEKKYNMQIAKSVGERMKMNGSYLMTKAIEIPACITIMNDINDFMENFEEMKVEKFNKIMDKFIAKLVKTTWKRLNNKEREIFLTEMKKNYSKEELEHLENFQHNKLFWSL